MLNQKVKYYDVPPESEWFTRFDVLLLKRDHRRILNVQPYFKLVKYSSQFGYMIIIDSTFNPWIPPKNNVMVKDWDIDFKIMQN